MSVAQTVQGNSLNLQRCHLLRKLLGEPMRRPHLAIPSGEQQVIVGCATHAKTQTLFLLFHQVGAEFSDVALFAYALAQLWWTQPGGIKEIIPSVSRKLAEASEWMGFQRTATRDM